MAAIGEAGHETGIVIIDPLRAGFLQECEAGAENDPTTMTSVLSPLRRLSRVTNWSIILPHHNNRGRDQYAGSAAIPENTDAMWSISRDEDSPTATLRITTRDGILTPKEITETPAGITAAVVTPTTDPFRSKWPTSEASALTRIELQNVTGVSKATFYRNAKEHPTWVGKTTDDRYFRVS